tara:strand:+ start:419 stop:613 length:195 start_codon:yes stop_codon:yes gene_type:complete
LDLSSTGNKCTKSGSISQLLLAFTNVQVIKEACFSIEAGPGVLDISSEKSVGSLSTKISPNCQT